MLFISHDPPHKPQTQNSHSSIRLTGTVPSSSWIFDCGATDSMTYDSANLLNTVTSSRTQIQTANRERVDVTRAGTVEISPKINLQNCLLIPSLTHKL